LPPLAPQVSEVRNAALVELEAAPWRWITPSASSLLMYVRLQSRCCASADALTVAGFLDRGRETLMATGATVSVVSVIPAASR